MPSVRSTALYLFVLGLSMNCALNSEAREYIQKDDYHGKRESWTNAEAKLHVSRPPRGPPDATQIALDLDDVQGNNKRNVRAMPISIKAKEQQDSTDQICELPLDEGHGVGKQVRYFYNSTSGMCEEFSYGGCGGNENSFLSLSACKQRCSPSECPPYCSVEYCSDKPTRTALCTIPNRPGEASSCNTGCHITNCKVCYYADEYRPLPGNCETCDTCPTSVEEGNRKCFKQWATCIRRANGAAYGNPTAKERTQDRLKCYEHPCL